MKNVVFIILFSVSFGLKAQLQEILQDSIYFYNPDGTQNWWYVQKDVFSFRLQNGLPHLLPYSTDTISSIQHFPYSTCKENELSFNPNTTPFERQSIFQNQFANSSNVEWTTVAITDNKITQNDYTQHKYFRLNDMIMVNFIDPNITFQEVNAFMQRNHLTLYHQPSVNLPTASWTYVFKISFKVYESTFHASREIFTNEQDVITRCVPDIEGLFKPSECVPVNEMNEFENTSVRDAFWHVRNRGFSPIGTYGNGTNGADSKICECWAEGFHGEGIKVAVIDFGGYDYSHPDMQGQFLEGYDLINGGVAYNTSFWDISNPRAHGMAVSSTISAKANVGYIRSAVGVAYNAKIIPMLMNGLPTQVIIGIQKAVEVGADLINMSFGNETSENQGISYLYFDILYAKSVGRNGLGILSIASTGNNDSKYRYNWPAADSVTLGVGASDPNDYRGSSSQSYNSWNWIGGSNYSNGSEMYKRYHLVAPGTLIYSSNTQTPLNNPIQKSEAWTGTSFATPITTGVAAILLSKNPGLTSVELENTLVNNADKVRQERYNYYLFPSAPGFNEEMFEGRLNCINSLNDIGLGLSNLKPDDNSVINLVYYNENEFGLYFNKQIESEKYIIDIYNIAGQKVFTISTTLDSHTLNINSSSFNRGVYLIHIQDTKNKTFQTLKYIK